MLYRPALGRLRGRPPQTRYPDCFKHGLELRGIHALFGGDHHRQRLLPLLNGEVDLDGQSAPGAAETVVNRLCNETAGRLLLKIPLFAAPAACW